jgi:hypothetical protein
MAGLGPIGSGGATQNQFDALKRPNRQLDRRFGRFRTESRPPSGRVAGRLQQVGMVCLQHLQDFFDVLGAVFLDDQGDVAITHHDQIL